MTTDPLIGRTARPAAAPSPRRQRHGVVTKSVTAGLSTSMALALVAMLADSAQANQTAPTDPAPVAAPVQEATEASPLHDLAARLAGGPTIRLEVPVVVDIPAAAPATAGPSARRATRKRTSTNAARPAKRSVTTKRTTARPRAAAPRPKPTTSKQSG